MGAPITAAAQPTPVTPIQHVIVIIGENRSFDHVYGTYVPTAGQTVFNLLSEGIVTTSGTHGPNYALSAQNNALDLTTYAISPSAKAAFATYADHVSVIKFIKRNWGLPTIGPLTTPATVTRDAFPNPTTGANPYVPTNSPALDDLFDGFNFLADAALAKK